MYMLSEREELMGMLEKVVYPFEQIDRDYDELGKQKHELAEVQEEDHWKGLMILLLGLGIMTLAVDLKNGQTILYFLLGGLIAGLNVLYNKNDKKKRKDLINELLIRIQELETAIQNTYVATLPNLGFLPENYHSYLAISTMLDLVKTGRADTQKEAMNLFDVHLHHMKMEQAQQEIYQNTIRQNQMLLEYGNQLNRIERKAGAAEFFSAMSALTR